MQSNPSFILYDASAGSGKTFTLVRNYISDLLTEKVNFRNVLAITFTNKAVAEMKTRILDSLTAFSQPTTPKSSQALFDAVQEITGMKEDSIRQKSQEILIEILHNYAAFQVSTIDGFTHQILRVFAKDLNIPVNFEVQMETDEILEEAVDKVISKAGRDKRLTRALLDFSFFKIEEDKSWDISRDLYNIARILTNEIHLPYLEKLKDYKLEDFAEFEKELRKEITRQKDLRKEAAKSFFQLIEENQINPKDFSGRAIPKHFEKLADGNFINPSSAGWARDIHNAKIYNKGLDDSKKAVMDSKRSEIGELYEITEKSFYRTFLLERVLKNNSSLSLINAIQQEVDQLKEERKLLLISEFNRRISESIKDEPAPFIYERLGQRYSTYYIDEFQDTSALQWNNLKPLIADSLASGYGKLTLVGDAKQSIYRWRGGNPEQFMDLNQGQTPFPGVTIHLENLQSNYRSLPEVVRFNNDFFNHAAQFINHSPYRELFEKAAQNIEKDTGGYVEIQFCEVSNADEKDEVYPEKSLKIIWDLIDKNHTYDEICILVRKRKQGVTIASYLSEHGIPIVTSETLLLANSPKVNFLLNILRLSLNIEDKNSKAEVIDFLYDYTDTPLSRFEFIYKHLQTTSSEFFLDLSQHGYEFSLGKLNRLPLYQSIEYILRAFKLNKHQDVYIQFFLDFVYDSVQQNTSGINGLLDLWELKKEKLSIIVPEGQDAVQINTIHKAKGLEFPIVIYPYAEEKLDDTRKDKVWIELNSAPNRVPFSYMGVSTDFNHFESNIASVYQQLLRQGEMDKMNVFYVALTRAVEQLYILTEQETKTNTLPGILVDFLKSKEIWDEDKEEHIYSFGRNQTKAAIVPKALETDFELYPEDFISSSPSDHDIHMVTTSARLWDTAREKALEKGNLIHYLLEQLKIKEAIPDVLKQAELDGVILREQADDLKTALKKIVLHPDLNTYFSAEWEVYTEKEILINQEYIRLDRLCIKNDEAAIIDYKSGKPLPQHQIQLKQYAEAIEKTGYKIIDKLLVYIENEQVKVISIN